MFIKRVLLAIRPNSIDIKKLIKTTEQLCKFYNASFTLLHVVSKELTDFEMQEIREEANKLLKNVLVDAGVDGAPPERFGLRGLAGKVERHRRATFDFVYVALLLECVLEGPDGFLIFPIAAEGFTICNPGLW